MAAAESWPIHVGSIGKNGALFSDGAIPPNYVDAWYESGVTGDDNPPVDTTLAAIYGWGPFDEFGKALLEQIGSQAMVQGTQDTNDRPSEAHVTFLPDTDLRYFLGDQDRTIDALRDVARVLFGRAGIENPWA